MYETGFDCGFMSPGHVMASVVNVCVQFDVVPAAAPPHVNETGIHRRYTSLVRVPAAVLLLSVLVVILYLLHVPATQACKMPRSV